MKSGGIGGSSGRLPESLAFEPHQSILCLPEASRAAKTAKMPSVVTGRGKRVLVRALEDMREAGEVALEAVSGDSRAAITAIGSERVHEEFGEMVVLHRLLADAEGAPR